MAYSRYSKRDIFTNNKENYRKAFFTYDRGIQQLTQYNTAIFAYPDPGEPNGLSVETSRWDATSKMYNIAFAAYGDSSLWWLIGWFNQKPTEAHWKIGEIVYIPQPADVAISIFERNQ
jgi:hypothetical protein